MKVNYSKEMTGLFSDLSIGDTFLDIDGNICIKTSYYNEITNAICYLDDGWASEKFHKDDEITPVDSELNILE